jgi:hypothetical protein
VRVFRTAVELDEYLSSLTDEERAQWRPTAYKDQINAARDVGIAAEERKLGHKARWLPHVGVPEWMRLGMLDVVLKWHEGRVLTCIHMPVPARPQPVFAAAWKPGVLVCAQCKNMLAVTGVADTICDGCGHQCKGLPDDGIMPVTAFVANLGYQAGVCVGCHEDMKQIEEEATGDQSEH